ncbi:MAG: hypothetical protein KBC72_00515 [Acinetobacter sp.]|nr:hypothetical protein [Acinetobacter sp.]
MASTQTILYSKNDYGRGIGIEIGTLVFDGGTASGVITPGSASGIKKIHNVELNAAAEQATFPAAVITYSATPDSEIVTVTGVANSTWRYVITGEVLVA